MATFQLKDVLSKLSFEQIAQIPRDVKGDMLRAAAEPVVAETKKMALATFSSGPTAESTTAEEPVVGIDSAYVRVTFAGERARKTPVANAKIAYLNNYGVKNRNKATKFIGKANEQAANAAAKAAVEVLFQWQTKSLK